MSETPRAVETAHADPAGFAREARPGRVVEVPTPIPPRTLVLAIAAVAVGFCVVSFVLAFARHELDVDGARRLQQWFNVDREATIPTWFSSALLLAAALATASLNRRLPRERRSRYWPGFALALVVMSADETAAIHEEVGDQLALLLDIGGLLRFAWVIPASVIVVVLGLASRTAFRRLPRATARRMVLGIGLFLLGALVLELVDAALSETQGISPLALAAEASVEELLEMLGTGVYLGALLGLLTAPAPPPPLPVDLDLTELEG